MSAKGLGSTWTPKVCKIMAFMAIIGLGYYFTYFLGLGRYWSSSVQGVWFRHYELWRPTRMFRGSKLEPKPYLEVHCTYILLSNCSYNPVLNRITTVTLDILRL